jgi:hypothetical protein
MTRARSTDSLHSSPGHIHLSTVQWSCIRHRPILHSPSGIGAQESSPTPVALTAQPSPGHIPLQSASATTGFERPSHTLLD